jgi:hypothetical protein
MVSPNEDGVEDPGRSTPTPRPLIFRLSLLWRLLLVVGGIVLTALFIYVALLPFMGEGEKLLWTALFLVPVSLAMITVAVCGAISALRGRLVLSDDHVELTELTTRRVRVADISGYRIGRAQHNSVLGIYFTQTDLKPMKIDLLFERSDEIQRWFAERFPDLNAQDAEKEEAEILHDEELGVSDEDRRAFLASARRWCRLLSLAAIGVTFWGLFYPHPYAIAIVALGILPLLAVGALAAFRGVTRLDGRRDSAYPTVAAAFMMPPIALVTRAILDWNLLDYADLVLPGIVLSAALTAATYAIGRNAVRGWGNHVALVIFSLLYGLGVVVAANCLMDDAPASRHEVTIAAKRVEGDRPARHHLTVSAWGDREGENDVHVSGRQYDRAEEAGTAVVYVKYGALGCRWYVVEVPISEPD